MATAHLSNSRPSTQGLRTNTVNILKPLPLPVYREGLAYLDSELDQTETPFEADFDALCKSSTFLRLATEAADEIRTARDRGSLDDGTPTCIESFAWWAALLFRAGYAQGQEAVCK